MENKQKISKIEFQRTIYPFCPLGEDRYSAKVFVTFIPGNLLFDFIEVDREIQKLSQNDLMAEDVAEKVSQIMNQYNPKDVKVRVDIESNTHFPVSIYK